jgi:hypothetical protein
MIGSGGGTCNAAERADEMGFAVDPPGRLLLPNFGTQRSRDFHVSAHETTRLGTIEPGNDWVITGD